MDRGDRGKSRGVRKAKAKKLQGAVDLFRNRKRAWRKTHRH